MRCDSLATARLRGGSSRRRGDSETFHVPWPSDVNPKKKPSARSETDYLKLAVWLGKCETQTTSYIDADIAALAEQRLSTMARAGSRH